MSKYPTRPEIARVGIIFFEATISWATPKGQAISNGPTFTAQLLPVQILPPINRKKPIVVRNRMLGQNLMDLFCRGKACTFLSMSMVEPYL
jgi:hypothetical protein